MLQKNPHLFFGSPFIFFGSDQSLDEEDLLPFSFQNDLIHSNQARIGLFIHWFDNGDTDLYEDVPF